MKPPLAIPKSLEAKITRAARRLGKAPRLVLKEAIDEYVARHDPEAVTEAMNRVAELVDTRPDPGCRRSGKKGPRAHRVVIAQGEIWWADLPGPTGSGPGFRRPVLIAQGECLLRTLSKITQPTE